MPHTSILSEIYACNFIDLLESYLLLSSLSLTEAIDVAVCEVVLPPFSFLDKMNVCTQ